MSEVQKGHLDHLEELFERYQKKLFNFFMRLTYDQAASEDLIQNVFVRIMKYRSSYNPDLKFKTWIYQLSRNQFHDYYRKEVEKRDDFSDVAAMPDHDLQTDDGFDQDQRDQLEVAMQKLSVEKRELLVMSKMQGMHYEDIAEIKEITIANVKVQVHRALKELRTFYFQMN
ncbi:MAG: sigma-70 family RNA polymerase sigma factor [Cyclobacteriaceae bacterium]